MPPTSELLLALRAPHADWLAALVVALDEAMQDPQCDEHQRYLLGSLLANGSVPPQVTSAATERIVRFEDAVRELTDLLIEPEEAPPQIVHQRPKLTLCGGSAA